MKKAGKVVRKKVGKAGEFAVLMDQQGVNYLRVGGDAHGLHLILSDGRRVDRIYMDNTTVRSRDLLPAANGNVLEFAKSLYKPSGVKVQVSDRAIEVLEAILHDKEILAMARIAVAVKPKGRAAAAEAEEEAPAPAAKRVAVGAAKKGAKVAAPAKATKTKVVASNGTGEGRMRYAGHRIKVLDRDHGAREGTKRAEAMEMLFKCKTTDEALEKLAKMGADPSYIRFALGGFGGKQLIELI